MAGSAIFFCKILFAEKTVNAAKTNGKLYFDRITQSGLIWAGKRHHLMPFCVGASNALMKHHVPLVVPATAMMATAMTVMSTVLGSTLTFMVPIATSGPFC